MIVTVFRSRLKAANEQEYYEWAERIAALAKTMPGYVSHKSFTADDGEGVTIVEFESEEGQRVWATNLQHIEAKKKGRADFYTEYKLQVCAVQRESAFTESKAKGSAG